MGDWEMSGMQVSQQRPDVGASDAGKSTSTAVGDRGIEATTQKRIVLESREEALGTGTHLGLKNLTKRCNVVAEQNDEMHKELAEANGTIERLEEEIAECELEIEERDSTIAGYEEHIKKISAALIALNDEYETLDAEANGLRGELERTRGELARMMEDFAPLKIAKDTCEMLKAKLNNVGKDDVSTDGLTNRPGIGTIAIKEGISAQLNENRKKMWEAFWGLRRKYLMDEWPNAQRESLKIDANTSKKIKRGGTVSSFASRLQKMNENILPEIGHDGIANNFASRLQSKVTDLEKRVGELESKLEDTQSELVKTQNELGQTREELTKAEAELQDAQSDRDRLQAELNETQSKLDEAQAELSKTQPETNVQTIVKTTIKQSKGEAIAALEASRNIAAAIPNISISIVVTCLNRTIESIDGIDRAIKDIRDQMQKQAKNNVRPRPGYVKKQVEPGFAYKCGPKPWGGMGVVK
jgi:chromosome segregation ATPase